jgi:hypothetical protein
MNLLTNLIFLLNLWRPAFCKAQAFKRAKEHALAGLCAFGRKTITSFAIHLGREEADIDADYKLYSNSKWQSKEIFDPLLNEGIKMMVKSPYVTVSADDTILHKTGKKIPHASWRRDPMSSAFYVNLVWGLRFLQFSLTMPLYLENQAPARAIPIRFIDAPSIKKPGKKASEEELQEYRRAIKKHNLSTLFVQEVKNLRASLDSMGHYDKKLLMACDASFCNRTCFQMEVDRTHILARCRRNTKLCFQASEGGRRFYGEKKFTPEEIRQDDSIDWQIARVFYGGEWRDIRYKEVNNVLWQRGAKRKPLRIIVIAPIPYVRSGKRHYREPAYLLTTDIKGPVEILIQHYFDRFQIEYNHKDEKSILGVGQAQVRNEQSVSKQPALHVAAYSALLLANIMTYKDQYHEDFDPIPYWRQLPKRNTCRALIGLLRRSLLEEPEKIIKLGLTPPIISAILSKAA